MTNTTNIAWPGTSLPDSIGPDELHIWAIELSATGSTSGATAGTRQPVLPRAGSSSVRVLGATGGLPAIATEHGRPNVGRAQGGSPGDTGGLPASVLTPDEQTHAQNFQREEPRQAFIRTRDALRIILGRLLNTVPERVPLITPPSGKLRLADESASDLRFNVAHTAGLALIAATRGAEVGVDVEQIRPVEQLDDIAARYFTTTERDVIRAASHREEAFFSYWTRKEAILKAIGLGLGAPLDSFFLPPATDESTWIDIPPLDFFPGGHLWLQSLRPSAAHSAAVAVVGQAKVVQTQTFQF